MSRAQDLTNCLKILEHLLTKDLEVYEAFIVKALIARYREELNKPGVLH